MNVLGDGGESGGSDGGVGIEVAEGMEVTFRSPDGGEAMLVGEARALDEEAVAIGGRGRRGVMSEVEEAELRRSSVSRQQRRIRG
jgi:hypothetical protein